MNERTARPLTADELQTRFNLRRVRSLLNFNALPSKLALVRSTLKLKSNNNNGSKTPVGSLISPSEISLNDSKTNLKLKLMLNEPDVFNCLWQYWCLLADCDMLALDNSGNLCCMHQQWCLLHRLLIQWRCGAAATTPGACGGLPGGAGPAGAKARALTRAPLGGN